LLFARELLDELVGCARVTIAPLAKSAE
jgi:hypothetical protein